MTATARFAYRALAKDGHVERGALEAASESNAKAQIIARGLVPLSLTPRTDSRGRAPLSATDLSTGLRILANLVNAGLPISRALRTFEELAPKAWKPAMPAIRDQVKQGASLTTALGAAALDVPPLVLGIVRAGEAGAGLGSGLQRAAEIAESSAAVRSALRSALAYPMVVAAAGVGSIAVLVGVVLPRFAAILADFGQQLPPSTRFVLGAAAVAHRAFLPALFALIASAIVWVAWTSTDTGRTRWAELMLALPVIGTTRHASATARLSLSLSALLGSGVPLDHALTLAARSTGDAAIAGRTMRARGHVTSGVSLAEALERERAVTSAATRLIMAGEEAGSLPAMLAHAGKLEQDRAERMMRTGVRLVEPVLLLVFAGMVAVIAAALLQAVYSIRPTA
jgi:type II secretory pathway component PulF